MRSRFGAGISLGVVLAAGVAHADPTAQDRALAETLFRDAKELVASGKVASACPKFAESNRLDPRLGTLLYLATCHEQEGKTATAWIEFTEAASLAARARQSDREQIARGRAKALEQKLDHLVVVVKGGVDGEEVMLDDHPLGAAGLGTAMPIDPGAHKISATAPKKKAWSKTVTLGSGPATETVEIPALEDDVVAAVPSKPVDAAPSRGSEDRVQAKGGPGGRTIGWVLVGVGAAGLGVGTFFGLRAMSQESDAKNICPDKACPSQAGIDAHDDASRSALISTIGFGAGLVAAGAGVYFLLTSSSKEKERALWIAPQIGSGAGGLGAGGRF